MGNIQTGEGKTSKGGKGKGLMKIRGKKGKPPYIFKAHPPIVLHHYFVKSGKNEEVPFTSVVPSEADESSRPNSSLGKQNISPKPIKYRAPPVPQVKTSEPTEKKPPEAIQNEPKQKITPPSGDSSSDSVFTDALSPGCSTEINACYYSEESVNLDVEVPESTTWSLLDNYTLNKFKLNDYSERKEEQLKTKLSKLGLSKTSQFSLDSENSQCYSNERMDGADTDAWQSSTQNEVDNKYPESGIHSLVNENNNEISSELTTSLGK